MSAHNLGHHANKVLGRESETAGNFFQTCSVYYDLRCSTNELGALMKLTSGRRRVPMKPYMYFFAGRM